MGTISSPSGIGEDVLLHDEVLRGEILNAVLYGDFVVLFLVGRTELLTSTTLASVRTIFK